MSDEPKIKSLNQGLAAELALIELEARVELSPIGILDILVAASEVGDANVNDCDSRNNCPDRNNCNVDNCDIRCGAKNCNAAPACPGDACGSYDDCSSYG